MSENRFFIYLDILGFEEIPRDIAGNLDENKIRESFFSIPLKKVIENLSKNGILTQKGISKIEGSDDYILLIENLDNLIKSLKEITSIKLSKKYKFIPFEIAIEYKSIECNVENPINQNEVISFLKNDIITPYRKLINQPIKDTVILLTESAFIQLKSYQQNKCTRHTISKINNKGIKKEDFIYSLPTGVVDREYEISVFFNILQQPKSDYSGGLIDEVYIPPDEFDSIKTKLGKEKIVFITGSPGCGKTYTAIKLLWEYCKKGYTPRWIAGAEGQHREAARKTIANIESELNPHYIIYFEDPFGKSEYERRDDLKDRINSIINVIKNYHDVFVIVTSRKDIFEKFEKECYSVDDIKKFEEELNIIKPSYSFEKRKEILNKWAEIKQCDWLKNNYLKSRITNLLRDQTILPTPLNIYNFVEATQRINDEKIITSDLERYSNPAEKAFADEIISLYLFGRKDRVIFLSLIMIFRFGQKKVIERQFNNFKEESYDFFENIIKEEYRVKCDGYSIQFSHPSYINAFPYLLQHPGCKNLICELIKELSKNKKFVYQVSDCIILNFNEFPENIRNILFSLSKNNDTADIIAWGLERNFKKLPEDFRNILLQNLSEQKSSINRTSIILAKHFDELPRNIKINLLLSLLDKEDAQTHLVKLFAKYFQILPIKNRIDLLFKVAENESCTRDIAQMTIKNFDSIPVNDRKKLLLKLSKDDLASEDIANFINKNYEKIENGLKIVLLHNLSHNYSAALIIAKIIADKYYEIAVDDRNKLLLQLSHENSCAIILCGIISKYFDEIPEQYRESILLTLAENSITAWDLSRIIAKKYDNVSDCVKNLLFKLSANEKTTAGVIWAIFENYNTLPDEIQNLLLPLSENYFASEEVAYALEECYHNIPESMKQKIFYNLRKRGSPALPMINRLSKIV